MLRPKLLCAEEASLSEYTLPHTGMFFAIYISYF